jgi:hypothetical protein
MDNDKTPDLTADEQAAVQELHNVAAHIMEDCEVDDDEITFISEWLERNAAHRKTWPISTLFNLLEQVMEDGKVDESERLQLMSVFSGLAIFSEKK